MYQIRKGDIFEKIRENKLGIIQKDSMKANKVEVANDDYSESMRKLFEDNDKSNKRHRRKRKKPSKTKSNKKKEKKERI